MIARSLPPAAVPLALLLLSSVGASACAWMGEPLDSNPEDCVKVIVENHSFYDMNLFVERDGRLFRLGTVMSKQTTHFALAHRMMGGATRYRLVADPIGSLDKVVSPQLRVERDATTHWMLEPAGWLSHVVIR